jgi:hypothetical protein
MGTIRSGRRNGLIHSLLVGSFATLSLVITLSACSSAADSGGAATTTPSGTPATDDSAFPNDNTGVDLTTLQHDFVVQALQEYAEPLVHIEVAGKSAKTYAQASDGKPSAYANDQEQVAQQAITCMKSQLEAKPTKPALMLDVDETALSNMWKVLQEPNLAGNGDVRNASAETGDDTVIEATQKLYKEAIANNITVFFMSARSNSERDFTADNLKSTGYTQYERLILATNGSTLGAGEYKTDNREKLRAEGWTIITNVGDQFSDINASDGSPDEPCSYKLPNPYYFIPW